MFRHRCAIRRRLAGLLAAAVAAVALTAVEPAPRAAHAAACTGTTGVTVVVDFAALGGGVQVACALGDPATGVAALQGAGFTVTGTSRWGLAFVCRINGKPTAATDPCVNTPPATAYWSYWHASGSGAAWSYSTSGASSYNPAPGSVEGWSFGAGAAPSITAP
ncbi:MULTISPECIES: hypothetical protein [Micromonospora]|uniref:Flagellar hook-length control protein FliK n=1 Tax=Micromonospora yangpuensis TaxID=683228 RepID=A0A1C6VHA1_9ACTN|nr:hypothetical protein [Micromonospora yangpuensis]GGL98946.1 hypothetical protein GCM10012279_15460 [Micromonospora yangpuensis]SCL65434.1 hypothetical protein GA0070617_5764 [Micromonospora yangpuensis]